MHNNNKTLVDIFDHSSQRFAGNPAYSALGHTITFGELDLMARNFAAYLESLPELDPGDRIAIQLPNLLQYPVVAFGALRAGLVVVNTNPLYTKREVEHQLRDSGAKALVVLENFAATAQAVLAETDVKHVITTQVADLHPQPRRWLMNTALKYLKGAVPAWNIPTAVALPEALRIGVGKALLHPKISADDLAVLQYTGGTTGVAKGAMLTHFNLVSNMGQLIEHTPAVFRERSHVIVAPLPLYHIYAFNMQLLCALATGNHTVLIPNPRDISTIVKAFRDYRVTGIIGLNTLYNSLLMDEDFRELDFSSLEFTSAGGMACSLDTAARWQELTGQEIMEGYGLTETSPVVSANPMGAIRVGTVGLPVPDTEIKIVDEDGAEVPPGKSGELCVRGPQVMQGYWQRPDDTAEVLDDEGWLKTGDMALLDDGYIRIVDRKKDMICVSGFNVYPNEIEDVASMHPLVVECAAIGIRDDRSGEAVKLVVVASDPKLSEDELRSFCREGLTGYKIPKQIVFRSELPKSNVGKILRRELREQET